MTTTTKVLIGVAGLAALVIGYKFLSQPKLDVPAIVGSRSWYDPNGSQIQLITVDGNGAIYSGMPGYAGWVGKLQDETTIVMTHPTGDQTFWTAK
jgi:hypothetical protein